MTPSWPRARRRPWVLLALQTNQSTRDDAASREGYASLIDSLTVIREAKSLRSGASSFFAMGLTVIYLLHVVEHFTDKRGRLLVVGRIYKQLTAFPAQALSVFYDESVSLYA